MLTLFLLFSFAHLLGDYPFQTNWVYRQKIKSPLGTLLHVAILVACFVVVLAPLLVNRVVVLAVGTILLIHFVQDVLKIEFTGKRKLVPSFIALALDQLLHFAVLAGVAYRLSLINLKLAFAESIFQSPYLNLLLLYLITLVLATFVWDVVKFVWRGEKNLQHNWLEFIWCGLIVTAVFGAVYWLI
ncbi:MAG: DUF3307 domain-containing protein [Candidatus Peribacteraceae bacterium]|nr:DUF3307 domain-containing protein [Candidatus Peribacteraceae bacterium]